MVKISASLRNFRDRIRTSISVKSRNALFFLALFLVVTLAILIRLSPLVRGITLIKAFDPWIQWYNAEYLNDHTLFEYFNWVDYKSWYPEGYYRGGLRPGLTFTVVYIYKIFNFFGLQVSLYDICLIFPAIMGGITVLVIYFLGKEIHNRSTGLLAAFFLAFNPGFLQRTIAGFFDNETIGVFATLMTFLFFLKAIKGGKFSHSVIGGIFLGYLSLSWGGYQFVFLLIPLISIIVILTKKYSENVLLAYAGVEGTGLLIFSLYNRFTYQSLFSDLNIGGLFLFTIILVIFHIIYTKKSEHPKFYDNLINIIKWGFIPAALIFAVIIWVAPELIPFEFGSRFWTILNPLFRENIALVASVAEQMPSAWSVFYYNTLIPLLLVPLGIYFCFKRLNAADIFLIAFVILMYYFTGSMIRIIIIFAPAAALAGGYGAARVLNIFGSFIGEKKVGVSRKRRRQLKGTLGNSEVFAVYLVLGFLCIAQVVHTTDISIDQMSYAQMAPGGMLYDWEESLTWMKNNLDGTDVVVSWWDYGYWLTPVGNVTTVNDNATKNATRIGLTGMALMQTDEIYSAKAFRKLHAEYVLVYFGYLISGLGGDEGKWTWMIQICNDNYAKYKEMGMEEDNWAENAVFDENQFHNLTTGYVEDRWFESVLVQLMFAGVPTETANAETDLQERYASSIASRYTDNGDTWKSHIPEDGRYESQVFVPEYFSRYGLVKIYRIDYTVLDSSFMIKDADVFDSGYATFKLRNTGKKDLDIQKVEINGVEYPFVIGSGNNTVTDGNEELVWIDTEDSSLQIDDVVKINVTAQSEGLYNRAYVFYNGTSNFFVKEAPEGEIKINKENSIVIWKDDSTVDMYLEVENVGDSIVVLDRFYVNNDTLENTFETVQYLSGSAILEPTDKINVLISNATIDFDPIRIYNKIGVATPNNIYDELLFTSNKEGFSLSILSEKRILSPEELATLNGHFRKHIPIELNTSYAYIYDDGRMILQITVKNTGDIIFGLDSVYLTETLEPVSFSTIGGNLIYKNEEKVIIVDIADIASVDGVTGDINEEILVCVTGSFEDTVSSDIGYVHTIREESDIQIIETVADNTVSYIYANETGRLVIKNTGNDSVNLDSINVNGTLVENVEYLYGDSSLDIQECTIVTFDVPGLMINNSDECFIEITTNSSAELNKTLNAYVDSTYYNITIDDDGTSAYNPGDLTILINNDGIVNVTLESVYINGTYFSINAFTSDNGYEIGVGDSLELTIALSDIGSFNDGDKLEILVRSQEGAEDIHEEIVI